MHLVAYHVRLLARLEEAHLVHVQLVGDEIAVHGHALLELAAREHDVRVG